MSDVSVKRPSLSVTPIERGPLTCGQNSTCTFSSGLPPRVTVPVTGANVGPPEQPATVRSVITIALDVLAATGRKADAVTAAEQAVKLAHPYEPRPKQALEALKK